MLLCVYILWYLKNQFEMCNAESITYIDLERPRIISLNESVIKSIKVNSVRLGRRDPRHYLNAYVESAMTIDNSLKCDWHFYEWLTNRYKPSFVNLHYGFCDFLEKDNFIAGPIIRKHLNATCPIPQGRYNLTGLAILFVPKNFPFTRGRVYGNFTIVTKSSSYAVGEASVDIEIKRYIRKQTTKG